MFPLKEVMSVDEESTLCYCLLEAKRCHVLLEHPGRYALVGAPLNQDAAKRLRLAVFGSPDTCNSLGFTLRVYCVDDTPHAFQVWEKRRKQKGGLSEDPKEKCPMYLYYGKCKPNEICGFKFNRDVSCGRQSGSERGSPKHDSTWIKIKKHFCESH